MDTSKQSLDLITFPTSLHSGTVKKYANNTSLRRPYFKSAFEEMNLVGEQVENKSEFK